MALAPLTLGTSFVTGPGTLKHYGVQSVVHAVVNEQLGDPPRELPLRQAVVAAMREIDRIKGRHVAMLILGAGSTNGRISRAKSVPIMIEEIIGHLRRSTSRIENITLLCNSSTEMEEIGGLLERMRRDWWGLRV
jgi:O-acetyl-ADP-ribose deacetylase (regulator of RNase III)